LSGGTATAPSPSTTSNRFDPTKADDFLTFAVPTIRGEVRRHFRDHGWTVRPPRSVQELQAAINADAADPATGGARDVSDEQVAARLGVTAAQVREARAAQGCFAPTSLDAPSAGDREPLVDAFTGEPRPVAREVIAACGTGRGDGVQVKHEFFSSQVEVASSPHAEVDAIRDELRAARARIADVGTAYGVAPLAVPGPVLVPGEPLSDELSPGIAMRRSNSTTATSPAAR
jgi:hypothetical protein